MVGHNPTIIVKFLPFIIIYAKRDNSIPDIPNSILFVSYYLFSFKVTGTSFLLLIQSRITPTRS